MNKVILACLLALNLTSYCGGGHPQDRIVNNTAVTFIVDATDQPLFEAIESDFNQNLNTFFTNTHIGRIDFGDRLTVRMAPIEESDQLTLQKATIALTDRKVSRQEAARLRDPAPLTTLIASELDRYKSLCETRMTSSPIIDLTLKTIRETSPSAREVVVVLTDGVEASGYANFYRYIPTTEQAVGKVLAKVDPVLMTEAKEMITLHGQEVSDKPLDVVFVLKQNPKVPRPAELKQFYAEFFRQLGLERVHFIDNLSNNPNL